MLKTIYLLRPLAATFAGAALLATALITGAEPAAAQSLFQPVTAADEAIAASRGAPEDKQVVRQRLVRINADVLSRHVVPSGADSASDRQARAQRLDGVISLPLFPDAVETFKRTAVSAEPSGGYIWEGAVSDKPVHEALLVISNGTVSGRIQLQDRLFRIDPVAGQVHRITELDPSKFLPEAPPLVPPPGSMPKAQAPQPPVEDQDAEKADPKAKTIIRVLVAYTVLAQNEAKGAANILKQINQAIALANQAYKRGGINLALQLAGTPVRISYKEEADMAVDLYNLSNLGSPTHPGVFTDVRNLRAQRKADVVSLFRSGKTANACGIAWLPDVTSPFETMPMPSHATRVTGYSVLARNCVTNLSFHHEIGHNMGIRHDRYVDKSRGGYNFGYINKAKRLRTIMAYENACLNSGFNCARINWFSSPTIRASGKVTIGNAANDNTLRLKQTFKAVSKYY